MSSFFKEYKKDPFTVDFDVENMRSDSYLVEGEFSEENWFKTCDQLKIPHSGKCFGRLEITKTGHSIEFKSHIKCTMRRTCVRTLEEFDEKSELSFKERFYLSAINEEEEADLFEGTTFNAGELLVQHLILEMNNYPIHPKSLKADGEHFDVLDEQQDKVNEEKNPFSVLKSLKSGEE